jgi:hypothetical protein
MPEHEPGKIRPQPKSDDPADYWLWIGEALKTLEYWVPIGCEPDYMTWDHPDEDWKTEAEKVSVEREHARETEQALELLFAGKDTAGISNAAAHYVRERLTFGRRFARRLGTRSDSLGKGVVERSENLRPLDIMRWLTIDLYRFERLRD